MKTFIKISITVGLILIAITALIIYLLPQEYLSQKDIKAANDTLKSFITIPDPENDFVNMMGEKEPGGGKPNNLNPYPIPYCDIKSLDISADSNYVYFKEVFWGNFPRTGTKINNDTILGIGTKINNS